MTMEDKQSLKVVCEGGLNSSLNNIQLSDLEPGGARELINYEPGLFGGYRRLSGYQYLDSDYPVVDSTNGTGKILGIAIFGSTIIAARAQTSGSVYKFYYYTSGVGWTAYSTGLTLTSTGVEKIRWATFNFDNTEKIIFVDGVNNATLFDGTNWSNIDPAGTGADFANAGGAQALAAPNYVSVFANHIFVGKCSGNCHLVAHSAPRAEYDWNSGNGAGQIVAGFEVNQIKPFRDALYVFGNEKIKKITVSSSTFVLSDVTQYIGCVAPDSVVEIGGDLVFLAQDGFRPIKATERIGDIELETISKKIQQLINDYISSETMSEVDSVVVRGKSQVRFFFSNGSTDVDEAIGLIGGLRRQVSTNSIVWEWGKTLGIRSSCACSDYIGSTEYILHGDHDGSVFRQERGNDFNGSNVVSTYSTHYLDFGNTDIRKTLRKMKLFTRAEGNIDINLATDLDWGNLLLQDPPNVNFEATGNESTYGTAVYGTARWGGINAPVIEEPLKGSAFSFQFSFTTNDTNPPHSIQGFGLQYSTEGRK